MGNMKSEALIEYNKYADLYYEKFDTCYPSMVYTDTAQEAVEKIKMCLRKETKAEDLYPYDKTLVY